MEDVVLVHREEGRDVHGLAGPARASLEAVGAALAPGRIGHLGRERADGAALHLVVEAHGVEADAEPVEVEVPARPGAAAAREQRGVGVEHDVVGLVRMTPCGVTAVSSARVPRSHPRRGNQ